MGSSLYAIPTRCESRPDKPYPGVPKVQGDRGNGDGICLSRQAGVYPRQTLFWCAEDSR